jgi:hypothetical protein
MAKKEIDKANSHQHQPSVHLYVSGEHDEDTLHMLSLPIHQLYDDESMKA